MVTINCAYCNKEHRVQTGAYNRAMKQGNSLYCGRECSGKGRRHGRTDEENRRLKSEYDRQYREENREVLKKKKAEYFQRTYDPEAAKVDRRIRSKEHAEYCRTPEYRKYKKEYDRQYRAKKFYGEFWEAFLVLMDIENEVDNRSAKAANGLIGKSQRRKRQCKNLRLTI